MREPQIPEKPSRIKNKYLAFIWEVTKVVVISLAIIIPIRYFLIQPFYVKGASMEPNFKQYEYLIINQLSYRMRNPERGEVIVLRNPQDLSQFFIKRIIGLPGDHVEVYDKNVYINGTELNESPYLADTVETWGKIDLVLGENQYFVLGDNRNASLDSRIIGPITRDEIIGRAWIRAWPFTRAQTFHAIDYK